MKFTNRRFSQLGACLNAALWGVLFIDSLWAQLPSWRIALLAGGFILFTVLAIKTFTVQSSNE